MRKLIATVFNYSLDGLLADEGTEFWKFCFDLPRNREPDDPAQLDFLQSAYAHILPQRDRRAAVPPTPLTCGFGGPRGTRTHNLRIKSPQL